MMMVKTEKYVITRGKTEIKVFHKDDYITFLYEKHGPGTYADVADSISKASLKPANNGRNNQPSPSSFLCR